MMSSSCSPESMFKLAQNILYFEKQARLTTMAHPLLNFSYILTVIHFFGIDFPDQKINLMEKLPYKYTTFKYGSIHRTLVYNTCTTTEESYIFCLFFLPPNGLNGSWPVATWKNVTPMLHKSTLEVNCRRSGVRSTALSYISGCYSKKKCEKWSLNKLSMEDLTKDLN